MKNRLFQAVLRRPANQAGAPRERQSTWRGQLNRRRSGEERKGHKPKDASRGSGSSPSLSSHPDRSGGSHSSAWSCARKVRGSAGRLACQQTVSTHCDQFNASALPQRMRTAERTLSLAVPPQKALEQQGSILLHSRGLVSCVQLAYDVLSVCNVSISAE
jgi:hypothetical protein